MHPPFHALNSYSCNQFADCKIVLPKKSFHVGARILPGVLYKQTQKNQKLVTPICSDRNCIYIYIHTFFRSFGTVSGTYKHLLVVLISLQGKGHKAIGCNGQKILASCKRLLAHQTVSFRRKPEANLYLRKSFVSWGDQKASTDNELSAPTSRYDTSIKVWDLVPGYNRDQYSL